MGTVPGAGRAAPCGVRAQLLDVLGAFQGPLPGEGSACDARGRWRLSPLSQCSDFLSSQKVPRPHPVVEGKWEGRGSSHCPQATRARRAVPSGVQEAPAWGPGRRPARAARSRVLPPPTHTHQALWGAVSVPPTLRGPRGLGMLSQGARAFLKQLSSR